MHIDRERVGIDTIKLRLDLNIVIGRGHCTFNGTVIAKPKTVTYRRALHRREAEFHLQTIRGTCYHHIIQGSEE